MISETNKFFCSFIFCIFFVFLLLMFHFLLLFSSSSSLFFFGLTLKEIGSVLCQASKGRRGKRGKRRKSIGRQRLLFSFFDTPKMADDSRMILLFSPPPKKYQPNKCCFGGRKENKKSVGLLTSPPTFVFPSEYLIIRTREKKKAPPN